MQSYKKANKMCLRGKKTWKNLVQNFWSALPLKCIRDQTYTFEWMMPDQAQILVFLFTLLILI